MTTETNFPLKNLVDIIVKDHGEADFVGTTAVEDALASLVLGDSTTSFDITNPSGDTFRYTFNGTGTDPEILPTTLTAGAYIHLKAQNFNSANNGLFQIDSVGTDLFDVTNAAGVVESAKTIGTGHLNRAAKVLIDGTFSPADDIDFYGGCLFDVGMSRFEMATDKKVIVADDLALFKSQLLTIYGEGDSSNNYTLLSLEADSIEGLTAKVEYSSNPATTGQDVYPVVVSGDDNNNDIRVESFTSTITGGSDTTCAFLVSGDRNRGKGKVGSIDQDGTTTGDCHGIKVAGDSNVFSEISIEDVQNTAGGDGYGISVSGDGNAFFGTITSFAPDAVNATGSDNKYSQVSPVFSAGRMVRAEVVGMDLKTASVNTFTALTGKATQQFTPMFLIIECTAASSLTGDVQITVGTTPGGTDIVASATLLNLKTVGQKYSIVMSGLLPTCAGNLNTLDITITSADSGTSGTADVSLEGVLT